MPTLSKSSSIVKTPGAQSVKEAIEINETNIDAVISHYNTNAVETDDTDISSATFVVDEDDMSSDLATKVPTQQSVKAYVDTQIAAIDGVPSGVILMWSGAISAIPSGWHLCDGNNGTPNLTDRFVIHADADSGGTNDVGDTGGSKTIAEANLPAHTHGAGSYSAASNGAHTHNYSLNQNVSSGDQRAQGTGYTHGTYKATESGGAHTHSISGTSSSTGSGTDYMPKYYALAYIMKG